MARIGQVRCPAMAPCARAYPFFSQIECQKPMRLKQVNYEDSLCRISRRAQGMFAANSSMMQMGVEI
jgi:hypothetical protein